MLILSIFIIAMSSVSAVVDETTTTLVLENKDADWNVIGDGVQAVVVFNNGGPTFDYSLNAQGLQPETEYSLIYYADYADRLNEWGGDNPGALIGTGSSDVSGNLNLEESVDLGLDLPSAPDANIDVHDYCESDGYTNCHGAKLWLVPSSDYDAELKKVINWNPNNFLFETDMITYDFDAEGPAITVTHAPTDPNISDEVNICAVVTDPSGVVNYPQLTVQTANYSGTLGMNDLSQGGDAYCRDISANTINVVDGMVVTYVVTAVDEFGNTAVVGPSSYTYDGADPVADFECTPAAGEENLEVTCTSTSTDTVDQELDLQWTFEGADLESSTSPVVNLLYENDGLFTVTLTVTDNAGHSDTETKTGYIEVLDVAPVASFEESAHEFGESMSVDFTDTSESHDVLVSWSWNFGDEETSTEQNPTHTYADEGEYLVTLTVCDAESCDDATATKYVSNEAPLVEAGEYTCNEGETILLTATALDVPADYPLTYNWRNLEGGEEFEAEGESVNYTCGNGDAEVSVGAQVTDNDGDSGYDSALIVVNNVAPSADANGSYQSVVNKEVCFEGTATDVVDTEFRYLWDLDYDGEFSGTDEGQSVCTQYSELGDHTVALVVNDGDDDSEVATATVTVYEYGIQLSAGQNLISIPLVPQDTSVEAVLNGVNPEVVWAYKHNPETGENQWYFYSGEAGDLDEMIPGYGYYVIMSEEDTLYNDGDKYYLLGNNIPLPPQVTLTTGWNLVGHYGLNEVPKEEETQDLSGGLLTDLAEVNLLTEEAMPVSDWEDLIPGEGYWAFVTGQDSLLYAPSGADYEELN